MQPTFPTVGKGCDEIFLVSGHFRKYGASGATDLSLNIRLKEGALL